MRPGGRAAGGVGGRGGGWGRGGRGTACSAGAPPYSCPCPPGLMRGVAEARSRVFSTLSSWHRGSAPEGWGSEAAAAATASTSAAASPAPGAAAAAAAGVGAASPMEARGTRRRAAPLALVTSLRAAAACAGGCGTGALAPPPRSHPPPPSPSCRAKPRSRLCRVGWVGCTCRRGLPRALATPARAIARAPRHSRTLRDLDHGGPQRASPSGRGCRGRAVCAAQASHTAAAAGARAAGVQSAGDAATNVPPCARTAHGKPCHLAAPTPPLPLRTSRQTPQRNPARARGAGAGRDGQGDQVAAQV